MDTKTYCKTLLQTPDEKIPEQNVVIFIKHAEPREIANLIKSKTKYPKSTGLNIKLGILEGLQSTEFSVQFIQPLLWWYEHECDELFQILLNKYLISENYIEPSLISCYN